MGARRSRNASDFFGKTPGGSAMAAFRFALQDVGYVGVLIVILGESNPRSEIPARSQHFCTAPVSRNSYRVSLRRLGSAWPSTALANSLVAPLRISALSERTALRRQLGCPDRQLLWLRCSCKWRPRLRLHTER